MGEGENGRGCILAHPLFSPIRRSAFYVIALGTDSDSR
jgi:hypothetical protein